MFLHVPVQFSWANLYEPFGTKFNTDPIKLSMLSIDEGIGKQTDIKKALLVTMEYDEFERYVQQIDCNVFYEFSMRQQ